MGVGEVNIFEVRPHPFGLLGIYVAFGVLVLLAFWFALEAPTWLSTFSVGSAHAIGWGVFLIALVLALVFGIVANIVYFGNRWILTSDSLTQVKRRSLFDQQNSQLSLANLEDVTAQQNGLLAHIFNFGALKAETAGERSKFVLAFCPNPNFYAQQILQAREAFEQGEHYHRQENGQPTITTDAPLPPAQSPQQ